MSPSIVELPPMPYLMIDGKGDPNHAPAYVEAVQSLYSVAYGIRAISKAAGQVFTVMPLEGLWWWEDMSAHSEVKALNPRDKANFVWTMMILQPSHISAEIFEQVVAKVQPKAAIRLEVYAEGQAAQIMHIGAYDAEAPTIQCLHEFIAAQGYQLSGKHHEIYLSDPRKVEAAKLKTVIRQPVIR